MKYMKCENCLKDWAVVEEYDEGEFRVKCKYCGEVYYGLEAMLQIKKQAFKDGYKKAINDVKGLIKI